MDSSKIVFRNPYRNTLGVKQRLCICTAASCQVLLLHLQARAMEDSKRSCEHIRATCHCFLPTLPVTAGPLLSPPFRDCFWFLWGFVCLFGCVYPMYHTSHLPAFPLTATSPFHSKLTFSCLSGFFLSIHFNSKLIATLVSKVDSFPH